MTQAGLKAIAQRAFPRARPVPDHRGDCRGTCSGRASAPLSLTLFDFTRRNTTRLNPTPGVRPAIRSTQRYPPWVVQYCEIPLNLPTSGRRRRQSADRSGYLDEESRQTL